MLLVSYSATATAPPLTGSWFQPGSGSGSSSVALKCCTNNAAKLNESRKRAGWVVAVEESVRVEDVGDFGWAINMKVSCCPALPVYLYYSSSSCRQPVKYSNSRN